MNDALTNLLRPRLVLAVVVAICSTVGLVTGHLIGSEWAGAVIASMWWTSASGAQRESKEAL